MYLNIERCGVKRAAGQNGPPPKFDGMAKNGNEKFENDILSFEYRAVWGKTDSWAKRTDAKI